MKNVKKLITLTITMALCASQIQAQDYQGYNNDCNSQDDAACGAYCDSSCASNWSAAIPIGAIIVMAIIIASTRGSSGHHHGSGDNGNHHHHHRSRSSFDPFDPYSNSYGSYNSGSYSSSSSSSSSSSIFH